MTEKTNRPSVFIIGAAKSGTTSLASLLITHPKIDIGEKKEPEYFSFHFSKGQKWYLDQFSAPQKKGKVLIDASTGYTRFPQYPEVAKRLYEFDSDAKLVYLMRHPVDRAFSHYVHRYTKELRKNEPIDISFEEHIAADTVCVESSDYRTQIEQYLKYFSSNQILLIFTQDLKERPDEVIEKICHFIGVDGGITLESSVGPSNKTDTYLESRIRVQLTNRLKRIPGVSFLVSVTPKSAKERIYSFLRSSPLGQSSQNKFDPKPMTTNTREKLLARFKDSNRWIGELCDRDISDWDK